jgi:hypothetical protein
MDVVYSGVTKLGQNSDIILSRYLALTQTDIANKNYSVNDFAGRVAQPLPRVYRQLNRDGNLPATDSTGQPGAIYGEKMQKDPKYGYYTSRHLAWIRPDPTAVQLGTYNWVTDNWWPRADNQDIYLTSPIGTADFPYIHVVLGTGYESLGLPAGTIISGTDGSITGSGTSLAGQPIVPAVIWTRRGIRRWRGRFSARCSLIIHRG